MEPVWNVKFAGKVLSLLISLTRTHNDLDLKINSPFCNDGNWLQKYSPQSSFQGIFWSNCRVNPIPKSSGCVKILIPPRMIWRYHMAWKHWRSTCHNKFMLALTFYGSLKKDCFLPSFLPLSLPPSLPTSFFCSFSFFLSSSLLLSLSLLLSFFLSFHC